jgi:succinate dehydrogenase / fumarate reductase cytochrome b subunit
MFGRHEFIVRRVHSLLGLVPVGAFLAFHLFTNGSVFDGPAAFQTRVDQIYSVGPTTMMFLEWMFIYTPILVHGLLGMLIVMRGERNLAHYPYAGNFRYTLQRWTGVIAMLFIFYHVFHMSGWLRIDWWTKSVAEKFGGAKFDPQHAAQSMAVAIRASWVLGVVYTVGMLSAVYHLANGLWTMGITWGVWSTPHAQRWANVPCALVGLALAMMGTSSLIGIYRLDLPPVHPKSAVQKTLEVQRAREVNLSRDLPPFQHAASAQGDI